MTRIDARNGRKDGAMVVEIKVDQYVDFYYELMIIHSILAKAISQLNGHEILELCCVCQLTVTIFSLTRA